MIASPLTLRSLPTLFTDCVLVGHARKADVVFTSRQFFAMCAHMMNENPANFFLMPYQDKNGTAKFAKAYRANAGDRAQWAWDTITGKAKVPASIGFYPTNSQRQSRWAAMDFDIHDDDRMRAREFALKAFTILYQQPQFCVALTTSAGDPQDSGWHIFIFTAEFFPCDDWTRLLKQVADQIGAPIKSGICEIFPDDCRNIGRGIRAPGTWNPKTGEFGLIAYERVSQLLEHPSSLLGSDKEDASLSVGELLREQGESSPSSKFSLYRGTHGEWRQSFAITAPRSRHERLAKLVGTAFYQAGRNVVLENVRLQYDESNPRPSTSLEEHLAEFDDLWAGMERDWRAKLSATEREKFDGLTTDTERDAFRIIHNWSRADSADDFKIQVEGLAARIGLSIRGAGKLRSRFCVMGILSKTADYIPHKRCARYRWTAKRGHRLPSVEIDGGLVTEISTLGRFQPKVTQSQQQPNEKAR
jgi:hypothetical protein